MNVRTCIAILGLVLVSSTQAISKPAAFADEHGSFGLEARVSYVDYSQGSFMLLPDVSLDLEPKPAAMLSTSITYFVHDRVSLELSAGYAETRVELSGQATEGAESVDAGDLTHAPLLLSVRWHSRLDRDAKLFAYVLGGAGYLINEFDQHDIVECIYGPGARVEFDNLTGLHIGLGFAYFLTGDDSINLDLRKIWTSAEEGLDLYGFLDDEGFSINPLAIGISYTRYF